MSNLLFPFFQPITRRLQESKPPDLKECVKYRKTKKQNVIRFLKNSFLPRFVQRDPSMERWDYWTVILTFISWLYFTAWTWADVCGVEQLNSELNKISGLLRWRQTWKRMIFSHACLNWSLGTRQSKCSDWVTQSTASQSMKTHTQTHTRALTLMCTV